MSTSYKEIIGFPENNKKQNNNTQKEIENKQTPEEKEFGENLLNRAMNYRDFEINLTWERAKYFILFLSAIFIAYYTIKYNNDIKDGKVVCNIYPSFIPILLMGLGTLISYIWYLVNRGSKTIYENWEHHIDFIEEEFRLGKISRIHIYKDVSFLDLLKGYPISVSRANNLVSLLITGAFLIMFLHESFNLVSANMDCNISCYIKLCIIVVTFFCLFLITCFIKSGNYNSGLKSLNAYNRIEGDKDILKHKREKE